MIKNNYLAEIFYISLSIFDCCFNFKHKFNFIINIIFNKKKKYIDCEICMHFISIINNFIKCSTQNNQMFDTENLK